MPVETSAKAGGSWRNIGANGVKAKVSGVWQDVEYIYAKAGGSWRTVYVKDNTGPAAITTASATWNGNALNIVWTDPPDLDLDYVRVHIQPGVQPRIYGPNIGGGVQSYNFTDYIIDNTIYTVFLRPYDIYGNAGTETSFQSMAWTGTARGRTPLSTFILPTDSATWRGGSIIYADRVFQGSSVSGESIGVFSYGNQFWDKLRGSTISGASVETGRVNASGNGGSVLLEPSASTLKSISSTPTAIGGTYFSGTGLCRNGSCNWWTYQHLPSAWWPHMTNVALGSALGSIFFDSTDITLQGFLGNVSLSYMQMYGWNEVPGTITPGRVNIVHSG